MTENEFTALLKISNPKERHMKIAAVLSGALVDLELQDPISPRARKAMIHIIAVAIADLMREAGVSP